MTQRLGLAFGLAAFAALPLAAHAQADNSNSITTQDRVVIASIARNDGSPLFRWLRDDWRRRETLHAGREGLTAAELGMLYGVDFTFGAGAEGPVPIAAP